MSKIPGEQTSPSRGEQMSPSSCVQRRPLLRTIVVAVLGLACGAPLATAQEAAAPVINRAYVTTSEQSLVQQLAALPKRVEMEGPQIASRTMAEAALCAWLLKHDAAAASHWLDLLWAEQDMDQASPTYGDFSWPLGGKDYRDLNAIQFAMLPAAATLISMGNALPENELRKAKAHCQAAVIASKRQKVAVQYTNIWLMKYTALNLVGQWLEEKDLAAYGEEGLRGWLGHSRKVWFHEYASPTYYMVDHESLTIGRMMTSSPQTKAIYSQILDMLWLDIAAGYLPARGTLAGAHSRDYDFVGGEGMLKEALWCFGWNDSPPTVIGNDMSKILMMVGMHDPQPYQPSRGEKVKDLPVRSLVSTWGDARPGQDRSLWSDGIVTIGSANGWYGAQDKSLAIDLPGRPPAVPTISIGADPFNEPYGIGKHADRNGHTKPVRLDLGTLALQHEGTVLALCDARMDRRSIPGLAESTLDTSVILPLQADEFLLNDRPLELKPGMDQEVAVDAVIAMRVGRGLAAIRLLQADAYPGETARISLVVDPAGAGVKCARLTVTHHQRGHGTIEAGTPARTAWLMAAHGAAPNKDPSEELHQLAVKVKDAKVTTGIAEGQWKVTAALADAHLKIVADAATRNLVGRWLNNEPWTAPVFQLNGQGPEAWLGADMWKFAGKEMAGEEGDGEQGDAPTPAPKKKRP
jgi:hypothetical protein